MSEGERRAIRLRLEGRVQGVGFRFFTLRRARQHGLTGRVRNTADGAVEIEVAGPEQELAEFKEEVRDGPPAARVERIAEEWIEAPRRQTFDIEY